jgi:hypothetical protein
VAALATLLPGGTSLTLAQTFLTGSYTNTFDAGGNTAPFSGSGSVASWVSAYYANGFNTPIVNDVSMDANGNPNSGSMMIVSPLAGYNQNVFYGTFGNQGLYDFSVQADLTLYTNITFDIHVAPGTPKSSSGDFGRIGVGFHGADYAYHEISNLIIPGSSTNGWVRLSLNINHAQSGLTTATGIGFAINSYSGYPLFTLTNWIDNLEVHLAPPPPPPVLANLQTAVVGLNCTIPGGFNEYSRFNLATVNDFGYGFNDQPSVTYSWTINTFSPDKGDTLFQQHLFIVNGSPTPNHSAADYYQANCIWVNVQQNANGTALCSFQYKTNEPAGNAMFFNTLSPTNPSNPNGWPVQPVASLTAASPLGTWSLAFNGNYYNPPINVTITAPNGTTTNFVFDSASAALFTDPATVLLGAQPNSPDSTGETVVFSNFSISGNDYPFSDDFTNDTVLNTSLWEILAANTNGVVLVPPGSAYWLSWTLPDDGFSLQTASDLLAGSWQSVVPLGSIINNGNRQVLIATTNLPSASQGYFRLIQP